MLVLVVDDEEAGRYLTASIISSAGHTVVEAVDGKDALEKARAQPPDIIITDILMPRLDGFQLAREWKADPQLADVPFVYLTASYTDAADEHLARDLGADGFLSKPADPATLLRTVDDLTARSPARARRPVELDDEELLREYTDRIVHKLEHKLADLERANSLLERAMNALAEEVEVKRALVDQLHNEVANREAREAELQEERGFTQRILETTEVFIIGTSLGRHITLFSASAERISGYAADEVVGRDYVELFAPPGEVDARSELHAALVADGGPRRLTNKWVMRSGEQRVFDWSETVVRDAEGKPSGIVAFGIDATERCLRGATERVLGVVDLSVLLDHARSKILDLVCAQSAEEFGFPAVWAGLVDESGVLRVESAAGPAAPALAGLFESMGPTDCPVGDVAALAEAFTFSSTDEVPEVWRDLALAQGLRSAAVLPVRAHGETIGLVGAMSDAQRAFEGDALQAMAQVADRLGTAIAYSETRERLALQSAALESAASAIVIADISGRVLRVNPAFEALTGYSADEAVGQAILGEGAGYREPAYTQAWPRVTAGEVWHGEVMSVTRQGTEYAEDVTIAPVKDGEGRPSHVVIVKQDVSERVRFERLKSDFVAMVSHELRTPLTAIIGFADLLGGHRADTLGETRTEQAIEGIRAGGQRMKVVVEQLLEVSEIQAEGVDIVTEPRPLGPLLEEVVRSVPMSDRHTLELHVQPDMPPLHIDARRIGRAVRNVVENAVKYSPDGGLIEVRVRREGDEAVIAVSDRGVGIEADELPHLLEAFTQQDMSSTRSFGGTGLGLFVAYQFVSAHGGIIRADSTSGEGSTFEIRLPLGE